jgi:hypothetical protein
MIFIAWFVGSFFTMSFVSAFIVLGAVIYFILVVIRFTLVVSGEIILSNPRQGLNVSAQRSLEKRSQTHLQRCLPLVHQLEHLVGPVDHQCHFYSDENDHYLLTLRLNAPGVMAQRIQSFCHASKGYQQ